MENKGAIEARKERFNKKHESWGLVSRGENKLKSFDERRKLESQLKERVRIYDGNDNERDSIFMGYRKLREGVLSNGNEVEYLRVYLDSAQFAVNFGEPKDYLPILWALLDKRIEFISSALALHLAFKEGECERSFQIVEKPEIESAIQSWTCGNVFETYWRLTRISGYGKIVEEAIRVVDNEIRKGVIAYRNNETKMFIEGQLLRWK